MFSDYRTAIQRSKLCKQRLKCMYQAHFAANSFSEILRVENLGRRQRGQNSYTVTHIARRGVSPTATAFGEES